MVSSVAFCWTGSQQGCLYQHGALTHPPAGRPHFGSLSVPGRNWRQCCRAASNGEQQDRQGSPEKTLEEITKETAKVLPKSGYFSLADPTQEVYSKAGERFDPMKKPGRFKPEFIWNTDWQKTLEMQESLERKRQKVVDAQNSGVSTQPAPKVGAVSFSILADMDRMDVDMSELLRRKSPEPGAGSSSAATSTASTASSKPASQPAGGAARQSAPISRSVPLPRNDIKRLERSNRASKSMVTTVVSTKAEDQEAKARIAEIERQRYEEEKVEQRTWTAAFSLLGAITTYTTYGREVCISYTVGALAGYVYLRLLGRSVDGMGETSLVGGVASALGNQRLLIPVILALSYNRWNTLYADESGVHLSLLAMLVGFLTYKIAVISRQGTMYLNEISVSNQKKD